MLDLESLYRQPSHIECPGCFVGKSAVDRIVEVDYSKLSQASLGEAREIIVGAIKIYDDILLNLNKTTLEQATNEDQL